jgi:glutathione S-transferase
MKKTTLFTTLGGALALTGSWWLRQKITQAAPALPEADPQTALLFQFAYSPYCVKVQHILTYKHIPFQTIELTPLLHQAFSRRESGQVKVPFLRYRGQTVADSSAIAFFLEQQCPEPALLPADPVLREQVLLLEDWCDEALAPALGRYIYVSSALNPQTLIENPAISTGVAALDRLKPMLVPLMLKRSMRKNQLTAADLPQLEARARTVLQQALALLADRPYLVGTQLTLADLTLAAFLNNADQLPFLQSDPQLRRLLDWQQGIHAEIKPAANV